MSAQDVANMIQFYRTCFKAGPVTTKHLARMQIQTARKTNADVFSCQKRDAAMPLAKTGGGSLIVGVHGEWAGIGAVGYPSVLRQLSVSFPS